MTSPRIRHWKAGFRMESTRARKTASELAEISQFNGCNVPGATAKHQESWLMWVTKESIQVAPPEGRIAYDALRIQVEEIGFRIGAAT
jgi:hypothetical protein